MLSEITDLSDLEIMLDHAKQVYARFPDKDNQSVIDSIQERIRQVQGQPAAPVAYHGKMALSNAQYHAAPGISASSLKYLEESPLHLEKKHLWRRKANFLDFGTLVHALVLEPDITKTEFAISPKFNLRTNAGKDDKAMFEQANEGKIIIDEESYEQAEQMAHNVLEMAGALFTGGEAESSYFAEEEGILVKCRPDYMKRRTAVIADLKTISQADEFNINKAISNYRYDRAAAFYPRVLRLLDIDIQNFALVFVESTEPYFVKVRMLPEETLIKANEEIDTLMAKYLKHKFRPKGIYYKIITPFKKSAMTEDA